MDGPQQGLGTEQRLVRVTKQGTHGEMGNWLPPEGSITVSFSVLSSLKKMSVPGSGKPTDDEG